MTAEHEEVQTDRSSIGIDAPDAAALVGRMVEAGEWPDPELLQQILGQGDAAVGSLVAILKTRPRGWPQEAPLFQAAGLLSMLRPPAALPGLWRQPDSTRAQALQSWARRLPVLVNLGLRL